MKVESCCHICKHVEYYPLGCDVMQPVDYILEERTDSIFRAKE